MFKVIYAVLLFLPNILFAQTLDLNKCDYVATTQEFLSIINNGNMYKNSKINGLLCYKSTSSINSEMIEPYDIITIPIKNGYPHGKEVRYSYRPDRGKILLISPISNIDMGYILENSKYELNREIEWLNGKRDGIEKIYTENGQLLSETPWKNGKKNGIEKSYHFGEQLWSETPWKNGKREGISKEYYESGILYREITWKNNMQNGITKMYYDNGILEVETYYLNDEKHGIEKWYDVDGTLDETIKYNNGVEIIDLY